MNALRYRILLFILALAPLGAWGEDLTITTEAELRAFVANVNNGTYDSNDVTVYLANDIELKEGDWTPIGTSDHPFKGHFEGWGTKSAGLTSVAAATTTKDSSAMCWVAASATWP